MMKINEHEDIKIVMTWWIWLILNEHDKFDKFDEFDEHGEFDVSQKRGPNYFWPFV